MVSSWLQAFLHPFFDPNCSYTPCYAVGWCERGAASVSGAAPEGKGEDNWYKQFLKYSLCWMLWFRDRARPPQHWPECWGCRHQGFPSLPLLCLSVFYTSREQTQSSVFDQNRHRHSHIQFNLTWEVLKHQVLQNHQIRANSKHVLGYFYWRDRVSLLCVVKPPRGFILPKTHVPQVAQWHKGCTVTFSKQRFMWCFLQTSITAVHRST